MARMLWLGLVLGLTLGLAAGCSKRVPREVSEGRIDASQRVAVAFKDGSELVGKIGENERVGVTREGHVYRGTIFELTFDEIRVIDCRLVRRADDNAAEWERLTDARHDLGEPLQEFTFRIDQIERVERIQVDALRTTTQSIFWTLAGAISAFLMAERS
jgi:hypothetical protein